MGPVTPATFTRISILPSKVLSAFSTIVLTSMTEVTSTWTTSAIRPQLRTSAATSSIAATSRPARRRSAPSFAIFSVIALPRPFTGPVMIAFFPSSLMRSSLMGRGVVSSLAGRSLRHRSSPR